jgi:hypothetical protein
MCDGFLTLAKVGDASATPSCFLVPRWLPDGSRNEGFQVMRLKDKLADRYVDIRICALLRIVLIFALSSGRMHRVKLSTTMHGV